MQYGKEEQVILDWLFELENYRLRYGGRDCFVIQAVAQGIQKEVGKYAEAAVHKSTVIGDHIWTSGIKTVYQFYQDFWKDHDPRAMGISTKVHYFTTKKKTRI